jgi:tetratricopeptide (TPR) repeat protein
VAWNGLGLALAGRGAANDAIAAFQRAATLSPKLAEAQFNRGEVYFQLGRSDPTQYSAAIAAYTAAVVANGAADYPQAFLRRGQAHFNLADYQSALNDFETAIGQNHLLGDALYGVARSQIEQRQYAAAITAAGARMQLHEPDAADLCTRGLAFLLRGRDTKEKTDLQAALADFQQARTLLPTNPDIARRVTEAQHLANASARSITPFGRRPGPSTTASLQPDAACRL